jgi:prolyl-tRNA synthetase
MRMTNLFGQTLREAPAEAEIISHQLLLRAGYIRQLSAGIFCYLHLAKRSLTKIENIMREEIDRIGGQEISMPVVHPADIWKESRRWYKVGAELARFQDRNEREMVLAMTHEEVVADLVRKEIQSYRQLPRLIYHIQTKWRDDPRPRAGLIRVREFTMKDSYSLDADYEGLDRQYRAHYQAYFNIFNRCGLPVIAVKSDVGMMMGELSHEFMFLSPVGEDTLVLCDLCGYKANRQIARAQKEKAEPEPQLPKELVETPGIKTIDGLAEYLDIPQARTAKAVFHIARIPAEDGDIERFVFSIVRGDTDVNETKLANAIKAKSLRPASGDEIRLVGAVPGYASPEGLSDILIVADDLIPASPNLVAGANREGYHTKNVNYGRDFNADIVTDIVAVEEGDICPVCGGPLHLSRGIEVGNIFKLGTYFSDAMGCTFTDRDGQVRPVVMGSYGIGSGRLLASVAEERNDENGLIMPISIAPYQIHLVSLKGAAEAAEEIYGRLISSDLEVLFDDRDESPGVKFADADLIGIPIRITVSPRTLAKESVELKLRSAERAEIVPTADLLEEVLVLINNLFGELNRKVVEMPYDALEDR